MWDILMISKERLLEHNVTGITGFTIRYRPWELIHAEYFEDKEEAMEKEKFYKTGVGREKIKKLIQEYNS